jgi:signal transduction histidine kinase
MLRWNLSAGCDSHIGIHQAPVRTASGRSLRTSPWTTRLALALLAASIAALLIVPLLEAHHTRQLRHELLDVVEPARGLVTRIHLALAVRGSALQEFSATGRRSSLQRYFQELRTERVVYEQLAPLTDRLGSEVRARFRDVRRLEEQRHAAVNQFLGRSAHAGARPDRLREDLYGDALLAAARLDEAITRAAEARRAWILAAERVELGISIGVGILAFIALGLVAWIGRRLRAFADEAERRRHEIERAAESRARLMRGISHDLRNPLGAIDGHAQLLQTGIKGELSPAQQDSLSRIRCCVQALLALVGDLLELSRAEAGQLNIRWRPVELREVIREAAEEYRVAAEAAGLYFELRVANSLPLAQTDPDRVRQILGNLLSNAVKYTPTGGRIIVRAESRIVESRPQSARWLVVSVTDNGPGIPLEEVEHIFDEFTRLERDASKPGAGLGLAIARRIARLLGGDITVESQLSQGATFTLWLPLNRRVE